MPKIPGDQGFGRFDFRPGVKAFPRWRGINRNDDPATIPSNQLWNATNIRLDHGTIVSRGGQSKLNTTPESGCIYGIYDVEDDATGNGDGGQFYVVGFDGAVTAPSGGTGATAYSGLVANQFTDHSTTNNWSIGSSTTPQIAQMATYKLTDCLKQPLFSRKLYPSGALPPAESAIAFDGKILTWGGGTGGYANTGVIYQITPGLGTASFRAYFTCGTQISYAVVVDERVIISAQGIDDIYPTIYFGSYASGLVYRFNTAQGLTTDLSGLGTSRHIMGKYHGNVVIAYDGTLRIRTAAGATTSRSLPGGITGTYKPSSMVEYLDILYVFGRDDVGPKVLAFTDVGSTIAHTGTGEFNGVVVGNYLYYAGGTVGTSGDDVGSKIGRFDGSTWTDDLYNFNGAPADISCPEGRIAAFGNTVILEFITYYPGDAATFGVEFCTPADSPITAGSGGNAIPYGTMVIL